MGRELRRDTAQLAAREILALLDARPARMQVAAR
jgi:hypothetical protein